METRSKKRLRLQYVAGTSEPKTNVKEEAAGCIMKMLIPNEILLSILRWLDRFDLDDVQIATKRLRKLVENNEMPLRVLDDISYTGDAGGDGWRNVLYISGEKCQLDDEAGIDMARRLLTSTFIRNFRVFSHTGELSNLQPIMAHDVCINQLFLRKCNFNLEEGNALEKTLSGSRFKELVLSKCQLPGWQLNDDLLRDLCHAGCDLVDIAGNAPLTDSEKYAVTDEGILDYCFSSELGALKDRGRFLAVTDVSITPTLLKKCIQASVESKVTGRVTLVIHGLEDVRRGQMAAFADNLVDSSMRKALYDFPDQGNGMRVKIKFAQEWWGTRLELRRANKDDTGINCDW